MKIRIVKLGDGGTPNVVRVEGGVADLDPVTATRLWLQDYALYMADPEIMCEPVQPTHYAPSVNREVYVSRGVYVPVHEWRVMAVLRGLRTHLQHLLVFDLSGPPALYCVVIAGPDIPESNTYAVGLDLSLFQKLEF